jgi:hypothetical protein
MVRYSLPMMKGDRLNFFQPSKVPSRGDSLMSATVTSLTIGAGMLAFVFDKRLEICFFSWCLASKLHVC